MIVSMKIASNLASFRSAICRHHCRRRVKILSRLIQVENCMRTPHKKHFTVIILCCRRHHAMCSNVLTFIRLNWVICCWNWYCVYIQFCCEKLNCVYLFENHHFHPCRGIHFRHMTLIEFNSTEIFAAPKWFSSIIICWIFSLSSTSSTQSHTHVTQICRHDFASFYSHVKWVSERDFFHHYSCTTSIIWCMMKISKLIKLYGVVWFLGDPQWKASFFIFTTSLETFLPWIHTIGILLLPLFFAIVARRKKWKTARVTQCTHINAIKHLFFILLGNWILSPFSSSHLRISISINVNSLCSHSSCEMR